MHYHIAAWHPGRADEYEREPIQYSRATPDNCISRLQSRLDGGAAKLTFDAGQGYLRSVLKELRVSTQTQSLVFSKTSFQRQRISPAHAAGAFISVTKSMWATASMAT